MSHSGPEFDVVWPLGRRAPALSELPPRLEDLQGKVIAQLWDWLYEGDRAFELIRDELEKTYPGITFIDYKVFGNIMNGGQVLSRLPSLLREHGCDAALVGVGHCGSCTPAVVRAALAVEGAGVPTVSLVGSLFERQAQEVSAFLGIEDPALAVYPGRIPVDEQAVFDDKVRTTVLEQVVAGLTPSSPRISAPSDDPSPRSIVFSGSLDAVFDHFEENQWTDGLPIVPPTIERVEEFLAHTKREPEEVIGVLLPERREATVWNVAVHGVMAGCRAEYMPVLLAVVEAVSDPDFHLEDAGAGTGWEPLIVASGPMIGQLGLNSGTGVMRVGRRANSTIGRFLRLVMRNLAGFRIPPGSTDKAGIGSSFNVVMAEDEATVESLGWPTFGEDRGVPKGTSSVTVQSVAAESPPFGEYDCDPQDMTTYLRPLVEVFGKAICGYWLFTGLAFGRWHPIVVVSPHLAKLLHANGWTKDDVRKYLYEESRVPASEVQKLGDYVNLDIPEQVRRGVLPAVYLKSDDPDRLIPTFIRAEWIQIVLAGNPDMYYQRGYMNSHAPGAPVTRIN